MTTRTIKPFASAGNWTQVHNYCFDHIMPSISANAWKVLTLIIRQTRGYDRQQTDGLSQRQMLERTGIKSFTTLRRALDELTAYVIEYPGDESTPATYQLNRDFSATETVAQASNSATENEALNRNCSATETVAFKGRKKDLKEREENVAEPSVIVTVFDPSQETKPDRSVSTQPEQAPTVEFIAPAAPSPAVAVWCEVFGKTLDKSGIELIDRQHIGDLEHWRDTCLEWKANEWKARNLQGLFERYGRTKPATRPTVETTVLPEINPHALPQNEIGPRLRAIREQNFWRVA